MKTRLFSTFVVGLVISFLCGCATTSKRDLSALQGTWLGHEVAGPPGECHMTIAGDAFKFQGARQEEWYTAKLVLLPNTHPKQADIVIENCSAPQYNGKTAKAIYRLEGRTLTIAAKEPGDASLPAGFERNATSEARVFVFNKQ